MIETSRKQTAKRSQASKKQSRRVSVADEDAASSPSRAAAASQEYGYHPVSANGYHQNFSPPAQPSANGYAAASTSEHGTQHDIYQAAYAQAYAHLQAQFQAASYQPAPPTQYPTGYGYGGQQVPGYPSHPFQPQVPGHTPTSMPMPPFPSAPGAHPASGANDDGLSNLLLAWYQSGYYTGRFQAIQEMRARNHR